jgi:hypothetical protein
LLALNGYFSASTGHSLELADRQHLAIAELHYAIFIAIKRSVATGRNWHIAAIHFHLLNTVGIQKFQTLMS